MKFFYESTKFKVLFSFIFGFVFSYFLFISDKSVFSAVNDPLDKAVASSSKIVVYPVVLTDEIKTKEHIISERDLLKLQKDETDSLASKYAKLYDDCRTK